MNLLNFPDVNVWLALLWRDHVHAAKAKLWFDAAAEEEFLYCRFTQIAIFRLLTTERVMESDVQTMAGAWKLWDRVTADDRISFVPEPAGLESAFRKGSQLPSASPKVWSDAYLVGFAAAANLKLVTFDRALKGRGHDVLVL
ncbi:MAG: TA system VapC family ribonuclease toxin [Acidobacteriaceae bacterium]